MGDLEGSWNHLAADPENRLCRQLLGDVYGCKAQAEKDAASFHIVEESGEEITEQFEADAIPESIVSHDDALCVLGMKADVQNFTLSHIDAMANQVIFDHYNVPGESSVAIVAFFRPGDIAGSKHHDARLDSCHYRVYRAQLREDHGSEDEQFSGTIDVYFVRGDKHDLALRVAEYVLQRSRESVVAAIQSKVAGFAKELQKRAQVSDKMFELLQKRLRQASIAAVLRDAESSSARRSHRSRGSP
jgi:hypothetical protein